MLDKMIKRNLYMFFCSLNDRPTDKVCYILGKDAQWYGDSSHKKIAIYLI